MGFLGDLFKGLGGAVPVAGPLISAGIGALQGREQNQANQEAAGLFNDFYGPGGTREQGANSLIDRLTASGYDPFGPQTTSRTGSTWGSGTTDSTTRSSDKIRQIVDAAQAGGKKSLEDQVFGRLGTAAVSEGEKMRQIAATNAAYSDALQGASDTAGIRGGGAMARLGMSQGANASRASDIANYLGSAVPQLERQRMFENEASAQGLLNDWKGQNRSGVSRTTGTTTQQGGSTGSMTGGPDTGFLANLLMPQAPMAPMNTGQNPWLNAAQDATGALSNLWGGRQQQKQPINPWAGMSAAGL